MPSLRPWTGGTGTLTFTGATRIVVGAYTSGVTGQLTIGTTATISAPTSTGVYYGGRSLAQLLRLGSALPVGTAATGRRWRTGRRASTSAAGS